MHLLYDMRLEAPAADHDYCVRYWTNIGWKHGFCPERSHHFHTGVDDKAIYLNPSNQWDTISVIGSNFIISTANRHPFKSMADLTREGKILFSGCVLEQGWRTLLHSVVKRWLDPENACGEGRSWSCHRPKDILLFLCGTECTSASKHFSVQVRTWALDTFQKVLKCGRIWILPRSLKSVIDVVKVWISPVVQFYF